jgi:hypothetical protein
MTSTFVRSLLVAGAAVGALSVAACSKPAAPADNATAAADATASNNAASTAMEASNTASTAAMDASNSASNAASTTGQ